MVGVRQRRESRRQLGEALTTVGLVMLVVTPIVYRVRTATTHARATRTLWWPTAWMVLPLAAVVIGVLIVLATSSRFTRRRRSSRRSPRTASRPPT